MYDVISYSTAASQSASGVERLLRCMVQWLRKRKQQEEELPSNTPYRWGRFLFTLVNSRVRESVSVDPTRTICGNIFHHVEYRIVQSFVTFDTNKNLSENLSTLYRNRVC